jgi:hypothetical protein
MYTVMEKISGLNFQTLLFFNCYSYDQLDDVAILKSKVTLLHKDTNWKGRKSTYNVTLRRVRLTMLAVEKQ